MDPRQASERIVSSLTGDDGALRRAGLELVIDHVLDQRVDAWLDVETVTTFLVQALAAENAERAIERHVLPGLARAHAALREANEKVGDAVPEAARRKLDALVTHPNGPRFAWLRGALDRDKLRALLAPALQELFMGFAAKVAPTGRDGAASGAASAAAGFVGRIGRGTGERLLNLGKSVADGLGVDLEARLRDAAKDYSHGAAAAFQRAIGTRLASPEAAALMEGLSRSVLEHVLRTPIATILDDLERLPLSDAIRLASPIVSHDLARELWRSMLETEVRAALSLEGARTLRELLDEAGLLVLLRAKLMERGEGVLRTLFASNEFSTWLARLLEP